MATRFNPTDLEPLNPSIHVFELHKAHRSTDFEALKMWKGRSGTTTIDTSSEFSWAGEKLLLCRSLSLSLLPTEHFTASEAQNRSFWAAENSSIGGFWGSWNVKCLVRRRLIFLLHCQGQGRKKKSEYVICHKKTWNRRGLLSCTHAS